MSLKILKESELTDLNLNLIGDSIKNNNLIVMPTETVYGIGCAMTVDAVHGLYSAKGRPETKPLPVLVANIGQAEELSLDLPESFFNLAKKFWPGPLTIIVKKNPNLSLPGLDLGSVALRHSSHPVTQKIIEACGGPIFLSSANLSGEQNLKTIGQIARNLGEHLSFIVDCGSLNSSAMPSTIISLVDGFPKLVRQGEVQFSQILESIDSIQS